MALSNFSVENAKPSAKPVEFSDGDGLYLVVQPNGSKLWRLKYSFHGKERSLSMGIYPAVSLADARARRDEAKKLLAHDVDPSVQKKLDRLAGEAASRNTFGLVAEEYVANLRLRGRAEITVAKNRWLLLELAAPIANRPIAEITAAEILDLLKRVERSGRRRPRAACGAPSARSFASPSRPFERPTIRHSRSEARWCRQT